MPLRLPVSTKASDDRILQVSPIEGKVAKSSSGLLDPRLYTGDNRIHAVMNPSTRLWSFKYEQGLVPNSLKQEFTSFTKLLKFAQAYFKNRNLQIKEITHA